MTVLRRRALWRDALLRLCVVLLALITAACNSEPQGLAPGEVVQPPSGSATAQSCETPQEGCACEKEGEVIDCGAINKRLNDAVICSLGQRVCSNKVWSACAVDHLSQPIKTNGQHLQTLGTVGACIDNPCDPYCLNYVDNAMGLGTGGGSGSGLTNLDGLGSGSGNVGVGAGGGSGTGGLTLNPGAGTGVGGDSGMGTSCTGMTISPAMQNFVVTSLSPLIIAPPSAQFTAQFVPAACYTGTVIANWDLSNPDTAVISDTGRLSIYSPVAVTQTIRAYVNNGGQFQAAASAVVSVAISDTASAPAGTVPIFSQMPVGADTATILYPYNDVVFPRGIRAPKVQWDTGALGPAGAIKISLRFPQVGAATFQWSGIYAEGALPSANIPQDVWTGFDQTASGSVGLLTVQREIGGTLYDVVQKRIRFSTAPLRGRIYYTEYQRQPDSRAGASCWFNNAGTSIRSLDPGSLDSPVNPFGDTSCTNVCHSVSAQGNVFVSSSRIATIDSAGKFTDIHSPPPSPYPGQDSRGFAWAGITPDGQYVLQGNNIWGNTVEGGESNTGASRLSTGNGNGLFADYYPNTTLSGAPVLSRIDQTVDFTWLAQSPDPLVPADQFSVRWYGKVQPLETENYTFETTTNDGVRLWVDGVKIIDHWVDQSATWQGSIALIRGRKYDIVMEYYENNGDAKATLRWSSPSTAYTVIPLNQLFAR